MKYLIALLLTITGLAAAEPNNDQFTDKATGTRSNILISIGPVKMPGKIDEKAAKLFRSGEFNLDLYGVGTIGNEKRTPEDVNLGGGIGATYWITRGFGLGVRGESEDTHHSVVDRGILRLSVRAPIWDRVAPYGYLDGAFDFERDGWHAGAGGGLDFRLVKGWGLFGEAGLQVDTKGEGQMRGAAGVRLNF